MSERLAVDSLMTADGEVVQLPTLGPLSRRRYGWTLTTGSTSWHFLRASEDET